MLSHIISKRSYSELRLDNKDIIVLPRSIFFEKHIEYPHNMSKKDLFQWLPHQFSDLPYESEDMFYACNISEQQTCLIYAVLKDNVKKISLSKNNDIKIFDKYLPVPFILPINDLDPSLIYLFLHNDELMIFNIYNNNIQYSRSLNIAFKNMSEINLFINESREYFINQIKRDCDISNILYYYDAKPNKYPVFDHMNINKIAYNDQSIKEYNYLKIDEIYDYLAKQNSYRSFFRAIIISCIILFIIYGTMHTKLNRLREKLNIYEERISKLNKEHRQKLEDFNIRNYIYKSEISGKLLLNAIDKIYTYLPKGSYIHQFAIRKNGEFYMRGITNDTVVNFIRDLEKTIYFSNVSIRYLSRKDNKKEVNFQITGIISSWENKL